MAIENSSVLDAAGIDKSTGSVCLSIFSALPWDNEQLRFLERKINVYLGAVESREIFEQFPQAERLPVLITVYCRFRPTDFVLRFFESANAVAKKYKASLQYAHGGQGYVDDVG